VKNDGQLSQKALVIFQNLFMLPGPHLFSPMRGIQAVSDAIYNAGNFSHVDVAIIENTGFWVWLRREPS
jgi:hypothetical protein